MNQPDRASIGTAINTVNADDLAWLDDAACAGMPSAVFFGADNEQPWMTVLREAAAKRICMSCPARAACLDDALAAGIRFGVFGGKGEDERARLRENLRRRNRAAERRAAS